MNVDLHTHTTASDGRLAPHELIAAARDAGVTLLSITDHDTVSAYRATVARAFGPLHLVAGVEFSTTWRRAGIHVLGLNIDPTSDAIIAATAHQQSARTQRAVRIAQRLQRCGIADALAGAQALTANGAVGRPHFAQFLVDGGFVKDTTQAFRKYLGAGKAGDVKQHWASLAQIIDWIRDGGGTAVLAHPAKYGLTRTKRLALIGEFRRLGGEGLEVISGRQDPQITESLAASATAHRLLATCGSDFHRPGQPWARLGLPLTLPAQCRPVWDVW